MSHTCTVSTEAAPVQAVSSVVTVDHFVHFQQCDHDFDANCADGARMKMVRARRVESDRAEWVGLTSVMTEISAGHRKAARALFRGRSSSRPVSMIFSPSSRCQLRLAQQGHGAVQRVVVGLFVHMLARYCQRGSRRRQTGAMVCRLRVIPAGLSASIIVRLKMAVP